MLKYRRGEIISKQFTVPLVRQFKNIYMIRELKKVDCDV